MKVKMTVSSKLVHLTDEIRQAVLKQLESAVYYGGEQAFRFEQELAAYLGAKHVVGVNSGTSAYLVGLVALGVGPGDDVIVPANVYVTNAEVVAFLGGRPVFCDVDEKTANPTVDTVMRRLTPKTKAVALTHLYGHPIDMDPILELARDRGFKVIEVGPHALGAEYKGRKVGTLGDVAAFSLGSKNISVYSTGGAVSTNSTALYETMSQFSRHGWPRVPFDEGLFQHPQFGDSPMSAMFPLERDSVRPGLNLQLDEVPCAIGRIVLKELDGWNERRREVARLYTKLIGDARVPLQPLEVKPWAKHAYLHYTALAPQRDALYEYLVASDIEAWIIYPIPIPEMRYYRQHFPTPPEVYPVARKLVSQIINLPINPWITDEQVAYVVDTVADFYKTRRA
jgi:dTDP-4-amino-4,6-dideoxygalactose transaminase